MIKSSGKYLLVQSCSARKNDVSIPVAAISLYDGYFYRIINNSCFNSTDGPTIDIRILSAEYGLIRPDEKIETYDRKMNPERAATLQQKVVNTLADEVSRNGYDEVVLNLGKVYLQAVSGLSEAVTTPVSIIEGEGIGEKGHILKQFLNGDPSVLRSVA